MELKDFVRDTLLDIVQGVKEAQDVCGVKGAIISPRNVQMITPKANIEGKVHYVQMVEFQVVLGEEQNEKSDVSGKGSISAVLAHVGIDIGMSKKIEEGNNNQTVIKFSVPVMITKNLKYAGLLIVAKYQILVNFHIDICQSR